MRCAIALGFAGACLMLTSTPGRCQEEHGRFANHGVAADVSRHHGAGALVGENGNRIILAWLHSFGDISKIAVNVDTGETTQIPVPGPPAGCGGPFRSLRSRRNLWYAHSAGTFYELDPKRLEFSFVQALEPRRCSMSAAEDDSGVIWMALYPTAELLSFHPDTRQLVNHGALNDEPWPQYPQRGLAVHKRTRRALRPWRGAIGSPRRSARC